MKNLSETKFKTWNEDGVNYTVLKTNGKTDDNKMTLIEFFSDVLGFKTRAILTNGDNIFEEGNESSFMDEIESWE
jgi:hypothetical protein